MPAAGVAIFTTSGTTSKPKFVLHSQQNVTRHAMDAIRAFGMTENASPLIQTLPLVGKMLGHRRHATTAGYAHLADGHLVAAAEHVGGLIAEVMAGRVASH